MIESFAKQREEAELEQLVEQLRAEGHSRAYIEKVLSNRATLYLLEMGYDEDGLRRTE